MKSGISTTAAPRTPLQVFVRTENGESPIAQTPGWELKLDESKWSGPGKEVHVEAIWRGDEPTSAGVVVKRPLPGSESPVVAPAVFYGDNGTGNKFTRYPRLGTLDSEKFTSPSWDFASERSALPAVFGSGAWLAVEPNGTGIGFTAEGAPELRAHAPGIEAPFKHDRIDETPVYPLRALQPGESIALTLWHGTEQAPNVGTISRVQRALQTAWGNGDARPLGRSQVANAADAAVDGLMDFHHRPDIEPGVLIETVHFDQSSARPAMHLAWVSGAPTAFALLKRGLRDADPKVTAAARSVLDKVASGLSPCGGFWGIWTPDGWKAGWNGDPKKLHARTLAEATLFLTRAGKLVRDVEGTLPENWKAAIRSNVELCMRSLDAEGNPGSFYQVETGEVLERNGSNGLLWAAALAEASSILDEPRYLEAAQKIGEHFERSIRENTLRGAPEDIGYCPSSEDSYNALITSMSLYETTGDARWLALGKVAADWMLTYRWSYDVVFPEGSSMDSIDFRTRGGDAASPSNHHLHNYGLICQRELLRLSELTGDGWYAARAADHLACFVDMVATKDGAFGGPEKRGMMAEQVYTANWSREGRAGEVGQQSHAWCLGLLLLAADEWREGADATAANVTAP